MTPPQKKKCSSHQRKKLQPDLDLNLRPLAYCAYIVPNEILKKPDTRMTTLVR